MVLNYKFENVTSFRECAEFSMTAPKTKVKNRFPNHYVSDGQGCDILKTAVIVGENAGGKSNFVESMDYLKYFFRENGKVNSYRNMIHINSILDKCFKNGDTCQSFELEIWMNQESFYLYHLEIDFVGIVKEELKFKTQYRHRYQSVLEVFRKECSLECEREDYKCSGINQCGTRAEAKYNLNIPGFEPEMEKLLKRTAGNQPGTGLYITKLAVLGNEHAVKFTEWMKDSLCPETNTINYDLYKSMRNEEADFRILHDSRFLEIFRMIDSSIDSIKLDEEHPFTKTVIVRKKRDGGRFSRELGKDSSGVREFFAWAVQIFKVVYENKIIFADEMDRVLNPVLSDRVIAFINGKQHCGQFIFTTHNVLHLDLKNYMKEQIYFITKDVESLESELYSLADFPEVRYETTKIYEFYMKGILGGTAVE